MMESMVSPSGLARIQLAIVTGTLLYTVLHIILYNAGVVAHVFFSADLGTLLLYTIVPTRLRHPGRVAMVPGSPSSSSVPVPGTDSAATGGNASPWVRASILKSRFCILVALAGLWAIQPYQLTDVDHPDSFDLLRDSHASLSVLALKLLNQKQQGQRPTESQFRDLKRNADRTAWAMQGLAVVALALATLVALEAIVVWLAREQQLKREQKETQQQQQKLD
ncbi:hypothetical protein EMPS_01694 [Entomortierella parvispora]|uniref:Uncharacterized protein n=1 Tax=Entomortierella parvispora TaxID=205924 RepID=A0A9P3H3E1_9FUNG|nr:hypothetical protein EMPS_01694 [Entomortierella parvispora]